MQLNAEDSGNRQFIMVQIAEPTDEDSEAYKAGYKSIADIGKERICRAGDKILTEWKQKHEGQLITDGENTLPDTGFKVFHLDSSNWQPWDDSPIKLTEKELFAERMEHHLNTIKPDRHEIDMVYEVFIKYGVPLTEKPSTLDVLGKRFYVVSESGYIFICLETEMTSEVVEAAAKYTPGVIIFAENSFSNLIEMTNAGLWLERYHIEFRYI